VILRGVVFLRELVENTGCASCFGPNIANPLNQWAIETAVHARINQEFFNKIGQERTTDKKSPSAAQPSVWIFEQAILDRCG
jgi:hypothetical protein